MATEDFKRKLTAVFSADVAGYSRLMGENEAATVKTLEAYKGVMFTLIRQHRGRVIDSPGDNLLAEFASVVDAVQCAVAVQKELQARNAELPENRRMQFRIGINLGDVIEERDRIYGDGVNIAARLESCADPGGICVSKTAFDHIETKLPLGYEYLGEKEVKNIAKPVGAYRVLMEPRVTVAGAKEKKPSIPLWGRKGVLAGAVAVLVVIICAGVWNFHLRPLPIEPASKEKMAFPLPDKPSVFVIPFVNLSEDPKQEFLSDGITDSIITALFKVPEVFVIGRTSTFSYKGKPVQVKQVSEQFGVRYVLEGSVQRSADRIRINAQLIDALKGHHVWAERYDRDLKDIFALQDEIIMKILTAIQVKLTTGEEALTVAKYYKGKQGLDCYLKYFEGANYLRSVTIESNNMARRIAEQVIALCPENPMGYFLLGSVYQRDYRLGNTKSPRETIEKGIELAQKMLALDNSIAEGHVLLSNFYSIKGEHEKAIAEGEKAVSLNPGLPQAHISYANSLRFAGRSEEAIPLFQRAIRFCPISSPTVFVPLGDALRQAGRFEEAVSEYKKAIQGSPDNILAHIFLAACYMMMGREKEAHAEAAEALRINPKCSLDSFAKTLSYKNQLQKEKLINALRKAGIPDKPPVERADQDKMAFPLPDVPSIAVLPFVNMSGDPKQEFLSDGITENIITALTKVPNMFVIARNSTFTYKGKPVKVKQVSEELGVQYVLEGSFQRSEDRLRITVQLIDALKGHHLWAERYDRDLKDIFALQDEITLKILTGVRVKLAGGDVSVAQKNADQYYQGKQGLDCYMRIMEASGYVQRWSKEGCNLARRILEEALPMCPENPLCYTTLGWVYHHDYFLGNTTSPQETIDKGITAAQKALAIGSKSSGGHALLCALYSIKREYDKAIAEGEMAVALNPSNAGALALYAESLLFAGNPEGAIPLLQKSLRLNPFASAGNYNIFGNALHLTGRYEEAVSSYKRAIQRAPDFLWGHLMLAATYSKMGREKEARAEAAEVLRIKPNFSLDFYAKTSALKNQSEKDKIIDALRRAGLK